MASGKELEKLFDLVLEAAREKKENMAMGGGMSDGGAYLLEEQVKFYKYGMKLAVPPEWEQYQWQLDPEWAEYQRLRKKFGV